MPDDKVTFEPATDIDPNAWYHMTEHRIDEVDDKTFDGRLVVTDREEGTLAVLDQDQGDWQFQPVDTDDHDARYAIRNTAYSVSRQLSVCWRGDEIANGKTQPCLTDSDGTDTQKWDIARWNGTEMFRFINVGNGTDYWMDCHRGNPPFMSDNIDTSVSQPAQQWILRSMSAVDDGAFSTIFTNTPTTALSSTATTSTSKSSASASEEQTNEDDGGGGGLSAGAAAGVGIGVGLGVIGLGLALFLFYRRRHRKAKTAAATSPQVPPSVSVATTTPVPPQDKPTSSDEQHPEFYGVAGLSSHSPQPGHSQPNGPGAAPYPTGAQELPAVPTFELPADMGHSRQSP